MGISDPNGVSSESYSQIASKADLPFFNSMTSNMLVDIKGDASLGGDLYIGGDMTFGDASTDTLTCTGALSTTGDVTFTMGTGDAFTLTVTDLSAPVVMTNTVTTAGTTGGRALFHVKTNAAMGGWANGVKGYWEATGTSGRVTGLASGVCGEIKTPNATLASGAYYALEAEYVAGGTSTTTNGSGSRAGFIYMEHSGDIGGDFDDNGYLFTAAGLTAGAGHVLSANDNTLRIQAGLRGSETTKYMVLSDAEDYISIDSCTTALNIGSSTTNGIDINSGTKGIDIGNTPTGIYFSDVSGAATQGAEHAIDFVDNFQGMVIETGSYSSAVNKGVELSDTNYRPVSFLFDDGGNTLTGNNRAVLSRVYLSTDQASGATICSIQGQLKVADNENLGAGRWCGVDGYLEFGGTTSVQSGSYAAAMNARIDVAASETVTVDSGGHLIGLHIHTTGTGTLTSTGNSYGIYINDQGTVDDWKCGIDINNCTTGMDIGTATTGINFSGTFDTALQLTSATMNIADDDLSLIEIGSYDTAHTITSQISANTFAQSINIENQANPSTGIWLVGSYNKIKLSTAAQTNTSAVSVMVRADIKRAIAAFYGIQSHVKFTAGSGHDVSSEVIGISAQIYGACAAGTGLHWGMKSDLRHTNCPTGVGSSSCLFCFGTVSCGSGIRIGVAGTKTMAAGICFNPAGNITDVLYLLSCTNTTNFVKFGTADGCVASETGQTCAGDGYKIKVDIAGSTFYLRAASDWT